MDDFDKRWNVVSCVSEIKKILIKYDCKLMDNYGLYEIWATTHDDIDGEQLYIEQNETKRKI